jgi:hypothetical protein
VKAVSYHPVEFSAVPFEKAIDLLIEVKKGTGTKPSEKEDGTSFQLAKHDKEESSWQLNNHFFVMVM